MANQSMTESALAEANQVNRLSSAAMAQELRNAEVTSAMGMLKNLRTRWQATQSRLIAAQSETSSTKGFFSSTIKTLRLAVQSAAIGAGALLVIQQEISPGMIIAGSILIGRALQPIEVAVGAWTGLADAKSNIFEWNYFGKIPTDCSKWNCHRSRSYFCDGCYYHASGCTGSQH